MAANLSMARKLEGPHRSLPATFRAHREEVESDESVVTMGWPAPFAAIWLRSPTFARGRGGDQ